MTFSRRCSQSWSEPCKSPLYPPSWRLRSGPVQCPVFILRWLSLVNLSPTDQANSPPSSEVEVQAVSSKLACQQARDSVHMYTEQQLAVMLPSGLVVLELYQILAKLLL